jgi:hypothetical protein
MEKNLEQWNEIAALIKKEKETALADFRGREFVPGRLPARPPATVFPLRLSLRPGVLAAAASLLLAAGLASLWLLRGNWQSTPAAPAGSEILAGSFLYGESGQPEGPAGKAVLRPGPYFTALAKAGLERITKVTGSLPAGVDPSAPVEHGDPEEVRNAVGRAIRENAFERTLARIQELNAQEA